MNQRNMNEYAPQLCKFIEAMNTTEIAFKEESVHLVYVSKMALHGSY